MYKRSASQASVIAVSRLSRGVFRLLTGFSQSVCEELPVVVVGENRFAMITAVHDAMNRAREFHSEFSGHWGVSIVVHPSGRASSCENTLF